MCLKEKVTGIFHAPRRFFDLEFEANRAFASGQYAHLIARTLLLQRQRTDIPFLNYVLKVSMNSFHAQTTACHLFSWCCTKSFIEALILIGGLLLVVGWPADIFYSQTLKLIH